MAARAHFLKDFEAALQLGFIIFAEGAREGPVIARRCGRRARGKSRAGYDHGGE